MGTQRTLKEIVNQAREEIQHNNAKAMLLKINDLIGHEFGTIGQNNGRPTKILGGKVLGYGFIVTWRGQQYSFYQIDFEYGVHHDSVIVTQDEILEFVDMIKTPPQRIDVEAVNGLEGCDAIAKVMEIDKNSDECKRIVEAVNSAVDDTIKFGLDAANAMGHVVGRVSMEISEPMQVMWRAWPSAHELFIYNKPTGLVCQQFENNTFVIYHTLEG